MDLRAGSARGMVSSLLLLAGCHLVFPFDVETPAGDGGAVTGDVGGVESGTDAPPADQGVPDAGAPEDVGTPQPDTAILDMTPVVPDGPQPKPDTGPTPTCQPATEVCVGNPMYGTFCILTCTATTGSNLQVTCAGTLAAGCSCYVDGAMTHFGVLGAPAPGDECLTCNMAKAAYCKF